MDNRMEIRDLIRDNIRRLVPYSSAREEYTGTASVFLDANENPYNAPLNRYPDPFQRKVKERVSRIWGQPEERIFLGNGSDEGIDLLIRILCEPGRDNIVTVDPTYGMYGVCAAIHGVEHKHALLDRYFRLDPETVSGSVDRNTRIVFLCSPNNPTSNSLDRKSVLHIVENVSCMVVVDEAYIDFSNNPDLLSSLEAHENLVVLRTLSKAWGLAGIRLGMVFAHKELIHFMNQVKYPYNLNTLTLEKAVEALAGGDARKRWVEEILMERERLFRILPTYPMVLLVHPSDANFLLVKVKEPRKLYGFLMERGIIVRDRSSVPLCEGCLRITVGTPEENRLLLQVLDMYIEKGG